MYNEKSDKEKKQPHNDNPLKVKCPFCGEYTSIIIDPKQISDKKSLHICLVCGQTFEYINK